MHPAALSLRSARAVFGALLGVFAAFPAQGQVSGDPLPPEPPPVAFEMRGFRRDTDWFEINAREAADADALAARAREVEAALAALIEPPEGVSLRIIVRLNPDLPADASPVLDVSASAVVTLLLPERAALSDALLPWLVRAALCRGGLEQPGAVQGPVWMEWVEQGLVEAVRVRLRPGLAQVHGRSALMAPAPALGVWLMGGTEVSRTPALCWLAVRAFSQVQDGRARLVRFAREAPRSPDPRLVFLSVYSGIPELASGAQAWWLVQVVGQAREQAGADFTRDWPGRVRRMLQVEVESGEEIGQVAKVTVPLGATQGASLTVGEISKFGHPGEGRFRRQRRVVHAQRNHTAGAS